MAGARIEEHPYRHPQCNGNKHRLCDFECGYCFDRSVASLCSDVQYSDQNAVPARQVNKGSDRKVLWFHETCGHTWEGTAKHYARDVQGCPFCKFNSSKFCDNLSCSLCFKKSLASDPRAVSLYSTLNSKPVHLVTKNNGSKFWWTCPTCSHSWQAPPSHVHTRGDGCPFCSPYISRLCSSPSCQHCFRRSLASDPRAVAHFSEDNNIEARFLCKNSTKMCIWKCTNDACGKTWTSKPNTFTSHERGCPHCTLAVAEKLVCDWFLSIGAPFKQQWRHEDCRDKMQLPFDFYLGDFSVPFCVEIDGSQHFRDVCHAKVEDVRHHDLMKMRFCVQRSVSMLRITSRTIRFYPEGWKAAFQRAVDQLTTDRALIVVEDNPQYRQMYRDSLEGDSVLGPLVVFV